VRFRDRISLGVGGAALLISVFCVGSAFRWTQALVGTLVAIALAVQMLARRRLERASPLVIILLVAIGLSVLQLIPLPASVLDTFVAQGSHLRDDGAALAGTDPWRSISLDPAGTLHALAFYVILLGAAVLALRFATNERGRYYLLATVALVCGLTAAITGLHTLFGADSLFGLYRPQHASPPVLGPLLNSNHLGSLMAVGTVLSFGLAFYSRQIVQLRVLWIVTLIGCAVVTFSTLSRGAALALLLGLAVAGALLVTNRLNASGLRRRRVNTLTRDLPIAIVIIFGIGLAIFTSAGRVADQLDNTSMVELDQPASKYAAWRSSFDLVQEAPLLGIGRGALEPVFTRVHEASSQVTFSHLENEYIQTVVEWGIPGALILGALFAWCVITAARKWRDGPLAAAALGALAGVAFHSSVDFGVELLGLALPVIVVAATVMTVPLRETDWLARTRAARAILVVALLAAALALTLSATRGVQEDHDDIITGDPPTAESLRAVIERHPLDYFGYGRMASMMARNNNGDAIGFLNHALALHPTHSGLHRLAARILINSGRHSQAAVEMSLAMNGSSAPHKVLEEIVAIFPDPAIAASAIPLDPRRAPLVLRSLKELKRDDIAMLWLVRVTRQPQRTTELTDKLYEMASDRRDLKIMKYAARMRLAIANTNTSRLMLAKAQFKAGEHTDLLRGLVDVAAWHGRIDEQMDAWLLVCDVHMERRTWDLALQCLHRIEGAGIVMAGRRELVASRIKKITEQRDLDVRKEAIEQMEQALEKKQKKKSRAPE
jgi:O-antigen ligase